jgi:hypothetical protein
MTSRAPTDSDLVPQKERFAKAEESGREEESGEDSLFFALLVLINFRNSSEPRITPSPVSFPVLTFMLR